MPFSDPGRLNFHRQSARRPSADPRKQTTEKSQHSSSVSFVRVTASPFLHLRVPLGRLPRCPPRCPQLERIGCEALLLADPISVHPPQVAPLQRKQQLLCPDCSLTDSRPLSHSLFDLVVLPHQHHQNVRREREWKPRWRRRCPCLGAPEHQSHG